MYVRNIINTRQQFKKLNKLGILTTNVKYTYATKHTLKELHCVYCITIKRYTPENGRRSGKFSYLWLGISSKLSTHNYSTTTYSYELFQARVLTPQLAETEKVRFFMGTQSLKQAKNQVHLVEFDEENSTLQNTVFYHSQGEIWKLNASPFHKNILSSCYNAINNENLTCKKATCLLKLPEVENSEQIESLEVQNTFDLSSYDDDIITNEFHPIDESKCATVTGNQVTSN